MTDLREAQVVGGDGELPFPVAAGGKTTTADLRTPTARFATLDYPRRSAASISRVKWWSWPRSGMRGLRELDGWR